MSRRRIVLDPDIRRLQDEGYEVEILNGYLLVHSVPYVTSQKTVSNGIVVTNLGGNIGQLGPPPDHQVWFVGDYPCHSSGASIEGIRHSSGSFTLWTGFEAQHRFSNKPEGGYPDYYSKMKRYLTIISCEAVAIDPTANPCTGKVIMPAEEDSVFRYWDSASSRANILAVSEKLAIDRVAIIGLGGTGAYVLDFVSKTSVREIHLFDGDIFKQHNAFRSPGAASAEILDERLPKVRFYAQTYNAIHSGIIPHNVYLTAENIGELTGFDFVFLCVDKGRVRKTISEFLRGQEIPFIDVGMGLMMIPEENILFGTCRATLVTPEKHDHFDRNAHQGQDDDDGLYRTNIQVADMNALNAALAVIKWKQFCGFYRDHFKAHHTTFSIDSHSLTRDEMA